MKNTYKYIVIEDDTNVWENIKWRMNDYPQWQPIDFSSEMTDAIHKVDLYRPELIFTDWSIKGGNAYQVLSHISQMTDYKPYIVFFTGYQSENPEIPQRIFNEFDIVNKYIVKPIYENLTNHLASYVKEAQEQAMSVYLNGAKYIETIDGLVRILPYEVMAILQLEDSRLKVLVLQNGEQYALRQTWEEATKLLNDLNINYFVASRKAMVNTAYIKGATRPLLHLENNISVRVSRDQWGKIPI